MKTLLFALLCLVGGAAAAEPVSDAANRYLKLVLAVGQHDPNYVDAYYGPPELQAEAERAKKPLPQLRTEVQAALALLAGQKGADADEALRIVFLDKQLRAMLARIDQLEGQKLPFDVETARLYDAVTPHHERAWYEMLVRQVNALLPGAGSLPERLQAFRARVAIPRERIAPVLQAAIRACRERTAAFITLPANEKFDLEFVTGKPWSGYNWYKGQAHSLIQINVEFPIYIDRAVELGCHEGYPGHHVYNAMLEQTLVKQRGWIEFSVYPLFSPMSLIAEGSANYGIQMAFTEAERLEFEKRELFPLAGLDPALAEPYAKLCALLSKLSYADNEAAKHYLEGDWSREQTIEWLTNVVLYPPELATQRLSFYDANRGYVITYNLGADLVREYVERHASSSDPAEARRQRWAAFTQLLSSPRLASGLRN